jgi:predicted RecB family nuclease
MKRKNDFIRLSASDLSNHLNCSHITTLDYRVATGEMEGPKWKNPDAIVLQQLGFEHERRYLNHLSQRGLTVLDLRETESDLEAAEETLAAMKKGIAVIAQATLSKDRWLGRADVLIRVEIPSDLGAWSYEVYDCKLARETKGATILQLSLYSELVAAMQGVTPQFMCVVSPSETFTAEKFNVLEYAAYYRLVKARLEQAVDARSGVLTNDAEPNAHCDVCRWWQNCDAQWRRDDHLSLVAGISRLQRKQLRAWEVDTMTRLASLPVPLKERPDYGSKEGYVRVREQARLQVMGRDEKRSIHEIFDSEGLTRLPAPSVGDIFFDLEGDAFVGTNGLEYLFGLSRAGQKDSALYECRWSYTPAEEKQAFEWFVDLVMQAWSQNPDMHVYHFSAREPAALKRLMGRYATREDAVDRMLRGGLLVDLHRVLKQSVRASVEEYSLKALEVFHNFARDTAIAEARTAMRIVEHSLELGREERIDESIRQTVESYNREDCLSTSSLRQWLEQQRSQSIAQGQEIPRPVLKDSEPSAALDERQQRVAALFAKLTQDVPVDPKQRTTEQSARWLLANLLDWHRREEKTKSWEYFHLKELRDEELLYERSALSGLTHTKRISFVRGIPTDQYEFIAQDSDLRSGDTLYQHGQKIGELVAINMGARLVEIKKMKKTAEIHPLSVYGFDDIPAKEAAESLIRLAEWIQANGIDAPGQFRCARDLLLRLPPRLLNASAGPLVQDGESSLDAARRIVAALDSSLLAIQGPPGSGKTFTAAKLICDLVKLNKRVGITGPSHKVIRNLLNEVFAQAGEEGLDNLQCIQKVTELSEEPTECIREITDNKKVLQALQDGEANIVAGTLWLWSRQEFADSVDVLFVDEAGQMSLANVLAVGQSAGSMVLLGDPQQLEQPLQASHPDGAAISALEHVLEGKRTISSERGLFLEETRRLHPEICRFTSEAFYDGRLQSRVGLGDQRIEGHPFLGSSGLRFVSVKHEGNQNASTEEADVIEALVKGFLQSGIRWFNAKIAPPNLPSGLVPFTAKDILIMAPYNAQVSTIAQRLPRISVGTVDKFQGQEAAIVIYSLTTSSPEDAPRGMEFLYSLNRLNVATSRGRALCIVVGSPRLLEPQCRTPRQMQLANALCRFAELAQRIEVSDARGAGYEFVIAPAA